MNFGTSSESSQSQQTSLPPEYAQRAQEAMLGALNMVSQPFLQTPGERVAGLNADQLQSFVLGRQYGENRFATPQTVAPSGQVNMAGGDPAAQSAFTSAGPAAQSGTYQSQFTPTGAAQGYTAQQGQFSSAGPAAQANISSIPSTLAGGAVGASAQAQQAGPAAQSALMDAQAQQLGADEYQQFLNPYTQDVVNTTQGQMQRAAAEQGAARNAAYAKAGAFGGSRQAVAQGVADSRTVQDIGNMTAALMAQGYDKATSQAMANAQMRQQTALQNSALGTQNNQFNAGQSNQLAGLNAQLGTQANIATAGNQTNAGISSGQNQTQASIAQANLMGNLLSGNRDAANNMAQFNTGQQNAMSLQNALMGNQSGQFNAGAANQFALNDSQLMNNMNLQNALMGNQSGQFNAGQQNQMNLQNALMGNQSGQFNAGQSNALNQLQIQQANQVAMQNAQNSLTAANMNNTFTNDQAAREQSAVNMLLGIGNQQQQQQQNINNVPWDTLQFIMNNINQTATAGREQQGTASSEKDQFSFGIGKL